MDQYRVATIKYQGETYYTSTGGTFCDTSWVPGQCAAEDISDNAALRLARRVLQRTKGPLSEECFPDMPFSAKQLFWVGNTCCYDLSPAWLCNKLLCHGHPRTPNVPEAPQFWSGESICSMTKSSPLF